MDDVKTDQINKFASEAKKIGKGKFKFAWVFDQMEDERERGITIDTNERSIDFHDKRINFVDTPGHLDYIFNMMRGASQVDVGILMIGIYYYSYIKYQMHLAMDLKLEWTKDKQSNTLTL